MPVHIEITTVVYTRIKFPADRCNIPVGNLDEKLTYILREVLKYPPWNQTSSRTFTKSLVGYWFISEASEFLRWPVFCVRSLSLAVGNCVDWMMHKNCFHKFSFLTHSQELNFCELLREVQQASVSWTRNFGIEQGELQYLAYSVVQVGGKKINHIRVRKKKSVRVTTQQMCQGVGLYFPWKGLIGHADGQAVQQDHQYGSMTLFLVLPKDIPKLQHKVTKSFSQNPFPTSETWQMNHMTLHLCS